jgi:oligopeptide/dipeptide ABC transporter ATP-binding protein
LKEIFTDDINLKQMLPDYGAEKQGPLLSVKDLSIHFATRRGELRAVRHVGFEVRHKEILGLVGESGCGKSVTARSILRLLKGPGASMPSGSIYYEGENLLSASQARIRQIRGKEISMIFQEPMTSLNPVFRVGDQVAEAIKAHRWVASKEVHETVLDLFRSVGISDPERRYRQFPHQLSGGLRQRVMISMALASGSSLLIADEPTTALDVTIQAQILDLVLQSVRDRGMSVLLISHDLGVIAQVADRMAVMYAGSIVEEGPVEAILRDPKHPYTRGLISCLPRLDSPHTTTGRLHALEGIVPELFEAPKGCPFLDRCQSARGACAERRPDFAELGGGRRVSCFLYGKGGGL